jgi:hypothetical protein
MLAAISQRRAVGPMFTLVGWRIRYGGLGLKTGLKSVHRRQLDRKRRSREMSKEVTHRGSRTSSDGRSNLRLPVRCESAHEERDQAFRQFGRVSLTDMHRCAAALRNSSALTLL